VSLAEHDYWAEGVGAYVLGAMPDRELTAFASHVEGCESCRAAVEDLRPAVDALPAATPHLAAPPELRERLLGIVRSEAELLRAAGPEADRPPRRRGWLFGSRPLTAALVAVALIVAGVAGFALRGSSGPLTRTIAGRVVGVPRASARIEIRGRRAELRVTSLPAPPPGRVYQVWLLRSSGTRPAATMALFTVEGDGSATVRLPSLRGASAVLVTNEPVGGSRTGVPSQRVPIISADL
jgi:anti-sigma-K factor RskA